MSFIIKQITAVFLTVLQFFGFFMPSQEVQTPIDNQNGGDPFIVEDKGSTYYTYTTGNRIDINKIVSYDDSTVLEQKTVYFAGNNSIVGDIWAPEIHKIGDRWYIISCALFDSNYVERGTMPERTETEDHTDYYRYGFVLESKTEDIFGEYEYKGMLAPDGLNNIDGTYLQMDGKLYYVCSGYVDVAYQCVFIAEMENPYTLKADENGSNNAVMLSKPIFRWEKHGWHVNEGPAVLYKDDSVYIFYSGSGYSSGEYCIGMLSYIGNDVMNTRSWYKRLTPIYYKQPNRSLYHTGHCSFLYRENGDIYMVYHATDSEKFSAGPRCTYIKKLDFYNGYPVLL